MSSDKKQMFKKKYSGETIKLIDWLAPLTGISKIKLKETMKIGGMWIKEKNASKIKRITKATGLIHTGDMVELYYDPAVLVDLNLKLEPIFESNDFGIFFKPAGLLTQPSPYSFKNTVTDLLEQEKKTPYIIQRLDRETPGILLVALNKKMAAYFSEELKASRIEKWYMAWVLGDIAEDEFTIDSPLDGNNAISQIKVVKRENGQSLVEIKLITGRFHQIRRHMTSISHPVMGDPKYGVGNKNQTGLKLVAYKLGIIQPQNKKYIEYVLPEEVLSTLL